MVEEYDYVYLKVSCFLSFLVCIGVFIDLELRVWDFDGGRDLGKGWGREGLEDFCVEVLIFFCRVWIKFRDLGFWIRLLRGISNCWRGRR